MCLFLSYLSCFTFDYLLVGCVFCFCSPPARRGSLDFIRTASARSKWALPDLTQRECQIECQKKCQRECQNICQKECQNECLERCRNRFRIECQKECQSMCQKVCQNRWQIECQMECQIKYAIYTSRSHIRNRVITRRK